ncbi:hypothetical protein BDW42DRAFT_79043 [Aspergillus taichungensis]|uniref:SnoaL-like domain-containing protein n=1 Tax=Aspergillus taichungensis TaxID=482145 RepID=A0A2J5HYJ6_9EURO|nr:hypothetical protein BDW42DRAFT_79043 [Aspergillus taichungensis]
MARYSPKYPDTFTDAGLRQWIIDFYSTVDTNGAVESITDFLTEDAFFMLGSQGATGRPDIIKLLRSSWDFVRSRSHTLEKVFPFDSNPDSFMMYGTVTYNLKDGRTVPVEWAGVLNMTKVDGEWKMNSYKVYFPVTPAF